MCTSSPARGGGTAGLPVHRDAAGLLAASGAQLLRYGGTFTDTQFGGWCVGPEAPDPPMPPRTKTCAWELFAGAPHERPPLTATADEVKVTKLTRWSRGWGPLEVLALCEALGNLTCVVALPEWQTPEQLAAFVEYVWGDPATSAAAARRAAALPGYKFPAPERAMVQVGNEQCASVLLANATAGKPFGFAEQAAAMEARATALGFGGAALRRG